MCDDLDRRVGGSVPTFQDVLRLAHRVIERRVLATHEIIRALPASNQDGGIWVRQDSGDRSGNCAR